MLMKLVVANQRGGVGKTVTSMVLGHSLSLKGKKTLLNEIRTDASVGKATRAGQAPDQLRTGARTLP